MGSQHALGHQAHLGGSAGEQNEADPPSISCWVLVALASGRSRAPRMSRFITLGQSTCMRSSPVEINLTNCQKSFPRPSMLIAVCHTDSACNNANGWIFNLFVKRIYKQTWQGKRTPTLKGRAIKNDPS